ncbi:sugar-binding transcriptional regulator [Pectinatus sottacetonis]|uniref:sugar-binding transcriptional regulator n=1 Tax=Pectinatus sottacetonis TaxID=1002795 RepID=UPI0018C7B10E|nr:sugar-binding transcriptional regulator [Pectinatus sottacetonis]
MPPVSKRILRKVAHMYYEADMKQSDIAKRLGLDRTTVSKYLKRAKEQGIVKITLEYDSYSDLENMLEEKFNLKEVYVVPSAGSQSETLSLVGKAALHLLSRLIKNRMVIGFNWGRSMGAIANEATRESFAAVNADFVPLVGGSESLDSELLVNTICYKVANAFNANTHYLYAPAITRTADIKDAIIRDVNYLKIQDFWNRLDIAFVGIGSPYSASNVIWTDGLKSDYIQTNFKGSIAGELCTRFYDKNGNEVPTEVVERTIAIPFEKLRKVNYSIGVAAAGEKVPAIYAAFRGKLINVLITDKSTAEKLLAY